jgi:LPXTG-motif cell wall-anchored protein
MVNDGLVRLEGLDNGEYYLEEIKWPDGYNQLTGVQKFTIADKNWDATINEKGTKLELTTGTGIQVINKGGQMLPETGAMGTTMFITFGMFVMLGTGILLVTKKRMSMIED